MSGSEFDKDKSKEKQEEGDLDTSPKAPKSTIRGGSFQYGASESDEEVEKKKPISHEPISHAKKPSSRAKMEVRRPKSVESRKPKSPASPEADYSEGELSPPLGIRPPGTPLSPHSSDEENSPPASELPYRIGSHKSLFRKRLEENKGKEKEKDKDVSPPKTGFGSGKTKT